MRDFIIKYFGLSYISKIGGIYVILLRSSVVIFTLISLLFQTLLYAYVTKKDVTPVWVILGVATLVSIYLGFFYFSRGKHIKWFECVDKAQMMFFIEGKNRGIDKSEIDSGTLIELLNISTEFQGELETKKNYRVWIALFPVYTFILNLIIANILIYL